MSIFTARIQVLGNLVYSRELRNVIICYSGVYKILVLESFFLGRLSKSVDCVDHLSVNSVDNIGAFSSIHKKVGVGCGPCPIS